MLRHALLTIITMICLIKTSADASTIEVHGKKYYNNCSYATSILGQVQLAYINPDITQEGVKVYLHYGLNGFLPSDGKTQLEWNYIKDVEMTSSKEFLWTNTINFNVHTKSHNYYYDRLAFVFMLVYPDGHVVFDNGGNGVMSYYYAALPTGNIECSRTTDLSDIPLQLLNVEKVSK